jgi:beta-lactamase class A
MVDRPPARCRIRKCTLKAVLCGVGAMLATECVRRANVSPPPTATAEDAFAQVEASVGGRVGVFAVDTGSGEQLARRADERFALCSTFKWVLVAAVLARVDRGQLSMDERVRYGASDLLEYAPTARAHVADGFMTVEALAKAAITAANLLLTRVGGPPGLTLFTRPLGDAVTGTRVESFALPAAHGPISSWPKASHAIKSSQMGPRSRARPYMARSVTFAARARAIRIARPQDVRSGQRPATALQPSRR